MVLYIIILVSKSMKLYPGGLRYVDSIIVGIMMSFQWVSLNILKNQDMFLVTISFEILLILKSIEVPMIS